MGNSLVKNLTRKQQHKNIDQRLTEIEQTIPAFGQAFQQIAEGLNRKIEAIREVLDAVSSILGNEVVGAKINEKRVQDAKALIELGLAEGQIVKSETIEATGLIVATHFDKQGAVVIERIQQLVEKLAPEIMQDIVGKTVPYRYVGPEMDLEIQEAYVPAPQPVSVPSPMSVGDGNLDQQTQRQLLGDNAEAALTAELLGDSFTPTPESQG